MSSKTNTKAFGPSALGGAMACLALLGAAPATRPATAPTAVRVACVGDSLTEGFPLKHPERDAYPACLARLLGPASVVQNFGAGGTTVVHTGDRPFVTDSRAFYTKAKAFRPDVVVLMMGTNDSKAENFAHQADFAPDLGRLIDDFAAVDSKPTIFLCLPPPAFSGAYGISNANLEQLLPLMRQVAADKKVTLIDVRQAMRDRARDFPDGIHPNERGAETIAQTVATAMKAAMRQTGAP